MLHGVYDKGNLDAGNAKDYIRLPDSDGDTEAEEKTNGLYLTPYLEGRIRLGLILAGEHPLCVLGPVIVFMVTQEMLAAIGCI